MRLVMLAFAFSLVALPTAGDAQQPTHVHLIGVLFTNAPSNDRLGNALSEGLRALGYVGGRDIHCRFPLLL
jgi:hypothetical protein